MFCGHYKLWIHSRTQNINSWSKVCQKKTGIVGQHANKVLTNESRCPHRMCKPLSVRRWSLHLQIRTSFSGWSGTQHVIVRNAGWPKSYRMFCSHGNDQQGVNQRKPCEHYIQLALSLAQMFCQPRPSVHLKSIQMSTLAFGPPQVDLQCETEVGKAWRTDHVC